MSKSSIEWTQETWNPLAGCSEISPGCVNCYAMTMAHRLEAMGKEKYKGTTKKLPNGKVTWTGKMNLDEAALQIPLKTKKPTMWFVNSMSDLFHEDVPDEFIDKVFAVMNATACTLPAGPQSKPWHVYQVLTKRADRMKDYMLSRSTRNFGFGKHPIFDAGRGDGGPFRGHQRAYGTELMNAGAVLQWPPSNVWLGVSVENKKHGLPRIAHLLRTPAAVRFLSVEPLLEDLGSLEPFLQYPPFHEHHKMTFGANDWRGIDWVIVGGESGPGARPFDIAWARSIIAQCKAAGVPCFVKQLGSNVEWNGIQGGYGDGTPNVWPASSVQDEDTARHSWRKFLKNKKGGDPAEWPEDLRVREMPKSP